MATSQVLCFVIHILLLFSLSLEIATSETTEGRALLKWKNTLFNTDVLHSWSIANIDNICKNWRGINCNIAGAVNEIELENFNLSGTLESFDFILFPNLTRLSLNNNSFTGSIPYAIANLSQLISLNLSLNHFQNYIPTEIEMLKKLRFLNLEGNNLDGTIPSQISHLQHLTYLSLSFNSLTGQIPEDIFSNLTKLQIFDCGRNLFQGPFPKSSVKLSRLEVLDLRGNRFFGSIPPTIGNLSSLKLLALNRNMLQGTILGTLCNLNYLEVLDLSVNSLDGVIPQCLGNITSLILLSLHSNNLQENIPRTLCNLHSLIVLGLYENSLDGVIPQCLGNVTSLLDLSLGSNIMQGNIPQTLCNIHSLEYLYLYNNSLRGLIPPCLGNVTSLRYLYLSSNILQGSIPGVLCNLQHSLEVLILSNNRLDGPIPQCLGNLKILRTLLVSKNQLQGTITPTTTLRNDINHTINSSLIYGKDIWLCSLSSLQFLDLSDNNLQGPLPSCLENFSWELRVINLARNQFEGTIPGVCTRGKNLLYFNLNGNHLKGPLPRGLENCSFLEVLDLGNNTIGDTFPHWSDALPNLRVLVLSSNQFYGEICTSKTTFPFPKLHIFDISDNEFTGPLPRHYMENFEAMKHANDGEILEYYDLSTSPGWNRDELSISLVWKGKKVQVANYNMCTILYLSNNNFHGEVPTSLGKLHIIRFLNLSHNQLTGYIPSSLGNLTILEVLDLSSNQLVGEIPGQLSKLLTFLAVLNLSYNNLSGRIPHGPQFDTFNNDSYLENVALCGFPLTLQCQDRSEGQAPDAEDSQNFRTGFGWRSVVIGYSCGIPFGIAIGYLVFKHGKPRWLIRLVLGD